MTTPIRLTAAVLLLCLTACGSDSSSRQAHTVITDANGIAIDGYDAVAYQVAHAAQRGSPQHALDWGGARWWFVSEENLLAFRAAPEKYAPAYGGWCAYGMAEGYAADTDPVNAWTVYEGRLYLNWDAEIASQWLADQRAFLEKSERNWPQVRSQLRDGTATVYWHDQ